ncbi:hypothetical protein Hanom_Chr00s000001g01593011 [Helianthus anomalus]
MLFLIPKSHAVKKMPTSHVLNQFPMFDIEFAEESVGEEEGTERNFQDFDRKIIDFILRG